MSARGTLLAVVAVVVGVALVAVPVFGAVGGIAPASDGASAVQTNETNETASNVSIGARISSFMQASSAETDSSVEAGMWAAKFNRSDEGQRPAVVQSRIDRLERRSERLRERMSTLQAKYENGTIPRVAYRAQASRLTAELDALGESINETGERARAVGVNTTQLDRLRTQARNLSGQEVAAVARELGVGRPDHAGPPADRGPDDAGPPDDRGPGQTGPPEDVGPSKNVTGDDQPGPPADRGGNGGPPGDTETGPTTDGESPADRRSNGSRGGPGGADGETGGADPSDGSDETDDDAGNAAEDAANGAEDAGGGPDADSDDSNSGNGGPAGPAGGSDGGGGPPGRT
ncbi:hypothetical protein ACOZ4N_18805 [Halorientalis pallida]|uniref:hypothetical protein n=1 Tax=Halorientalis pallida TaxID=2479928 RepID=UPI003C6EAC94